MTRRREKITILLAFLAVVFATAMVFTIAMWVAH